MWVGCWGFFSLLSVKKEHFCSKILWTAEIWINKQHNWAEKIKQKTPSVYLHMVLSSKEGGRNECVSYAPVLKESIFWLSLFLMAVKQQFSYTDFSCNVMQNCTLQVHAKEIIFLMTTWCYYWFFLKASWWNTHLIRKESTINIAWPHS